MTTVFSETDPISKPRKISLLDEISDFAAIKKGFVEF